MARLIKVTFKATSGEETTGFATLLQDETIELPKRMMSRVTAAVEAGEGYAIDAHQGGFEIPLLHLMDARFKLDKAHATKEHWPVRLVEAFRKPSKDQLQAYGRYCHTLSAAATVGAIGYLAGRPGWSSSTVLNALCLFVVAGVLLAIGAIYLKGEK